MWRNNLSYSDTEYWNLFEIRSFRKALHIKKRKNRKPSHKTKPWIIQEYWCTCTHFWIRDKYNKMQLDQEYENTATWNYHYFFKNCNIVALLYLYFQVWDSLFFYFPSLLNMKKLHSSWEKYKDNLCWWSWKRMIEMMKDPVYPRREVCVMAQAHYCLKFLHLPLMSRICLIKVIIGIKCNILVKTKFHLKCTF